MSETTPPILIRCRADGPLVVEGEVLLKDSAGRVVEWDRSKRSLALCRCGHSGQKPLCDGSHRRVGWSESAEVE